jgi:hypothetical protein
MYITRLVRDLDDGVASMVCSENVHHATFNSRYVTHVL